MARVTKSPTADSVVGALRRVSDPRRAQFALRFFRTGPGEYGEGDRFLGIAVPALRQVARTHRDLPLGEVRRLLANPYHEARLAALVILTDQYRRAHERDRRRLAAFYLRQRRRIDNWDLVDASARQIIGEHVLSTGDVALLDSLAGSPRLWDRRIAIIASWAFTRRGDPRVTLALAERLLGDEHDLMHKAVGWMLREVGKKDEGALLAFLDRHAARMPRTMLRYAIERLKEDVRVRYLGMKRGAAAVRGR